MQPSGSVQTVGFATNATFLRDAAGGHRGPVRLGAGHKSAATATEDGHRRPTAKAITQTGRSAGPGVAGGRQESHNIGVDALDELADRAPLLRDDAVTCGLIDRIGFRDDLRPYGGIGWCGKRFTESSETNKPRRKAARMYLARYASSARRLTPPSHRFLVLVKPTIAVVTLEGPIVNGRGGPQFHRSVERRRAPSRQRWEVAITVVSA